MKFRRLIFVYGSFQTGEYTSESDDDNVPSTDSDTTQNNQYIECIVGVAPENICCDVSCENMIFMDVSCVFQEVPQAQAPAMAPMQFGRKTLIPTGVRFDDSMNTIMDYIPDAAAAATKEVEKNTNILDDFYMDDALMNRKKALKRIQPPAFS